MKVLELFAGTRSISRAFEARGHETFSIEWDKQHPNISWYTDIGTVTTQDISVLQLIGMKNSQVVCILILAN